MFLLYSVPWLTTRRYISVPLSVENSAGILHIAATPTTVYTMRDKRLPAPKIKATRLKLKRPTSNHTSEPIIVSVKAIIVVIFIIFPLQVLFAVFN